MKSKQFCSVCKEWLEMEVVPTGDGDDDGVIWYRCPQCQGFLPKLNLTGSETNSAVTEEAESVEETPSESPDSDMPFDSPAEMMAAQKAAAPGTETRPPGDQNLSGLDDVADEFAEDVGSERAGEQKSKADSDAEPDAEPIAEPIAEYAAQLADALAQLPPDSEGGRPYRPWEAYEVGQCIQHLAWEDCGIVVGKEQLPGGRLVIKVFFQESGVVRLIEQAPQ